MKAFKTKLFLMATLSIALMSFGNTDRMSYGVDLQNSKILWTGYKVTGKHTGTVNLVRGTLTFDGENLSGGNFEIDMNSITCTDLEGEWAGKLVGHLKSDDFFGANNYPTAKFNITKVVSMGKPGEYKVLGDMTIKSTTKPVKFFTTVSKNAVNKNIATAKITIDRSEFDIKYGSGSFFDSLGDKTIYDEFELEISLVTK
ncbi:YceI family protein [Sphingobacteriales bacterium UPWRP_1]|nr:lipid-binding protein [Sphingobacteriales bacterium TSM_CSM]PSJ75687.1 YceI family protein [Sphingobacteriales bacterium UPWRP_1]